MTLFYIPRGNRVLYVLFQFVRICQKLIGLISSKLGRHLRALYSIKEPYKLKSYIKAHTGTIPPLYCDMVCPSHPICIAENNFLIGSD